MNLKQKDGSLNRSPINSSIFTQRSLAQKGKSFKSPLNVVTC